MWKNYGTAKQVTDGNIIQGMRLAYWITKAKDSHLKYVTLIASARHQWLRERTSILPYT
jgi:hypothetical protein